MAERESWKPQSYLDQLRPDRGWTVTLGLFATYSAEVFAVAATLLALIGKQNGRGSASGVHVIDAVDQLRAHVRIMAQAGRIAPPVNLPKIAGIFDQFVVDVPFAELDQSWHPKIALVRYSSPVLADRWRLWIGSRNLTGSRDLEAGLLLEGVPSKRSGKQEALGVGSLGRQLAERAALAGVDPSTIETELDRLRWRAPKGTRLKQIELFPGAETRAYGPPSGDIERLIVVSPFLCPIFVERGGNWGSATTRRTLVSTEMAIRAAGASKRSQLERFDDLLVFEAPELFAVADPDLAGDDKSDDAEVDPISLHAKFLVFRRPAGTRLIIGSANASDRAWSGTNAEVVATLDIDDEVMAGIDDLCGRARRIEVPPIDPAGAAAKAVTRFDKCRRRVSSAWAVTMARDGDSFTLAAQEPPPLPRGYALEVALATQRERVEWKRGLRCPLGEVPIFDQTGLVRFHLAGDGEATEWVRALDVVPALDEGRDLAAFGRHLGTRTLAAWLRGRFQPDLDTAPDEDWDRAGAGRSRLGGGANDDDRITLEEILIAWARDPAGFTRIDRRFRRLLDAVIEHGDMANPDERERLSELAKVWALAQERLGKRS